MNSPTEAWPEKEITKCSDLVAWVDGRPVPREGPSVFYRGQADSNWDLETSFARCAQLRAVGMNQTLAVALEEQGIKLFMKGAHLYLSGYLLPVETSDESTLVWLGLMQQHGAPTRMLDWTLSPYVAAYFAAIDHWDKDGAIWYVDAEVMQERIPPDLRRLTMTRLSGSRGDEEFSRVIVPRWCEQQLARMIAQQGVYTVCRDGFTEHSNAIKSWMEETDKYVNYGKLIIPAKQKKSFVEHLRQMNITAASLFPGVDGLGRSIEERLRVATKPL